MKIETSLAESEPWLPETIRFEKQFYGLEINEFMLLFFSSSEACTFVPRFACHFSAECAFAQSEFVPRGFMNANASSFANPISPGDWNFHSAAFH